MIARVVLVIWFNEIIDSCIFIPPPVATTKSGWLFSIECWAANKKASPSANPEPQKIEAPKTVERLEEISRVQNEKRKAEEEEEDDDDEETLQIFGNINLELDKMDVQNLDKNLKLEPDPVLNDVEILG